MADVGDEVIVLADHLAPHPVGVGVSGQVHTVWYVEGAPDVLDIDSPVGGHFRTLNNGISP